MTNAKKITALILALVLIVSTFVACSNNKNKDGETTTSENSTVVETVTDEQGEAVTDKSGEALTEVYEEIPVVDDKGNVVKDEKGETVTQRVPATTSRNQTTAGKNTTTAAKPNGSTTTTTKPSGGNTTTSKPNNTTTTKPPVTKPDTTKPTEKPTQKPTTPPTTEKPTQKPTTPPTTEKPKVYTPDYFVEYAKKYAKQIGLPYNNSLTINNAGYDTPITFEAEMTDEAHRTFKENQIRDRLNSLKALDEEHWITSYAVYYEISNGHCEFYLLYTSTGV